MEISIKLLEGIDDIEFGSAKEKFIELMGAPAQMEIISDEDEPVQTQLMEYPDLLTTFFFEGKNDKYYLNSCDTNNKEAVLFGKKIFSLDKKSTISLFKNMGFEKYETATEEWGEMRMTFENSMCDLYFNGNQLSSIIWGY